MEEQSNVLKEMATASKTETQSPNQEIADDDSSDSREEGELSSSDNDVNVLSSLQSLIHLPFFSFDIILLLHSFVLLNVNY